MGCVGRQAVLTSDSGDAAPPLVVAALSIWKALVEFRDTELSVHAAQDVSEAANIESSNALELLTDILISGRLLTESSLETERLALMMVRLGLSAKAVWHVITLISSGSLDVNLGRAGPMGISPVEAEFIAHLAQLYGVLQEREHASTVEFEQAVHAIRRHSLAAQTAADLIRDTLAEIETVRGVISAAFLRPDENGMFTFEFVEGDVLADFLTLLPSGKRPGVSVDGDLAIGRGPAGTAWRSAKVVVCAYMESDVTMTPWRELYREVGIRSLAAVPLIDRSGATVAIVALYSGWTGFFSPEDRLSSLTLFQEVCSNALSQTKLEGVATHWERDRLVHLLREQRVEMLFQPLLHIPTGRVTKVEALARLVGSDGMLISPSTFMSTFGAEELFELFKQGVRQSIGLLNALSQEGVALEVAINFPTLALRDPRYPDYLAVEIGRNGIEPSRITLELTEEDDIEASEGYHVRASLERLGVQFAQDDLGSGYSSLYRLSQFGFDEIKLDQRLVCGADGLPNISVLYHLIRLISSLGMCSTVEGLENDGLIEVVAILGADYAQGYAISAPLRKERIVSTIGTLVRDPHLGVPRTSLGALAYLYRWARRLEAMKMHAAILRSSELADEFRESLSEIREVDLGVGIDAVVEALSNGVLDDRFWTAMREVTSSLSGVGHAASAFVVR